METKLACIFLAAIVIFGLFLRLQTLHELAEPDSYYYMSIIEQAHAFSLPAISAYDGAKPQESLGIYLPALLLKSIGLTSFEAVLLTAPIFYVLEACLLFIMAGMLVRDNKFALLAVFLFTCFLPAIAKGSAGVYRGDSFIAFFIMLSLILFFKGFMDLGKHSIPFLMAGSLVAAISWASWSGGALSVLIASLALALMLALMLIRAIAIPSMAILSLQQPAVSIGKILWQAMAITTVLVVIAAFATLFIATFALFQLGIIQPGTFSLLTSPVQAFNSQSNLPGASIAELQDPSAFDIVGEFNIYMLSPAIILLIANLWGNSIGNSIYMIPIFALLVLYLLFLTGYLLFLTGKYLRGVELFIILAFWLMLSLYFASKFLRYEGMAAVPISIFFAFAIYAIIEHPRIKQLKLDYMFLAFLVLSASALAIILAMNLKPVGTTPAYVQALSWIKNNTPANASFYTLWSDGSQIQGIAQRFSWTGSLSDSNNQNVTRWFLSGNTIALPAGRPPLYVLVRYSQLSQAYGYCVTLPDDMRYLNCSRLYNASGLNTSYLSIMKPMLWRLLQPAGGAYRLVFHNNDTRIWQAG